MTKDQFLKFLDEVFDDGELERHISEAISETDGRITDNTSKHLKRLMAETVEYSGEEVPSLRPIYGFYEEEFPSYSYEWESEIQHLIINPVMELNGLSERLKEVTNGLRGTVKALTSESVTGAVISYDHYGQPVAVIRNVQQHKWPINTQLWIARRIKS